MVWKHGSNAFCNADGIAWQRTSNGFATRIEWFGNADRMVWKRALNGFATRMEWFGNLH